MPVRWCPDQHLTFLRGISGEPLSFTDDAVLFCYKGLKLTFRQKDEIEIFSEIYQSHLYAMPFSAHSIVLDIGANIGLASLYFACHPSVAHVESFEPFALTFAILQETLQSNPELARKITP
ncbi:MAG: hypothetical protein A2289_22400 [Deltaproteobacteria bacterium RIFOXYA12_FULL_58_15]|nr:MAG: hypothetical protein A2289_22400 [Deltaproteobacteria bacterium RIFOXYA12_FULL_58_15]